MKFVPLISLRYIFSRKRHNTINLITMVSMAGVAVGTLAIIIIMSVVNGIENTVEKSFSLLDPHLKISRVDGKVFSLKDKKFDDIFEHQGVEYSCSCLQQEGMMSYANKQAAVIIKGVDDNYTEMYDIDKILQTGNSQLIGEPIVRAMIGAGLSNTLHLGVDYNTSATIFTAKRNARVNLARPETAFIEQEIYVGGVVNTQQVKPNESMVIVPISVARKLLNYERDVVKYIELTVYSENEVGAIKKSIEGILGADYSVADRYEQQADFYKILQIEKWVTFLILLFILLVAIFNVIGSLSMIMIEKKGDISLFSNLGADKDTLVRLFTFTGWMITSVGASIGLLIGAVLCLLQETFGFVKMGVGLNTLDYPVIIQVTDVLIVMVTVLLMGFATSYFPVKSALKWLSK